MTTKTLGMNHKETNSNHTSRGEEPLHFAIIVSLSFNKPCAMITPQLYSPVTKSKPTQKKGHTESSILTYVNLLVHLLKY